MYYKVILLIDFGMFVTEIEGIRFHVLKVNVDDRFLHVCHRNERGGWQISENLINGVVRLGIFSHT